MSASAVSKITGEMPKRGGGARYVYNVLKDEILELKLAPGSALDETSLSQRFSMSRSPVREALVRLSANGLVKMLENRSTIVAPIDIETLPRYVEALDYNQRLVTRLAARHRSEDDIPKLTAAAKAYDESCKKGQPLDMSQANKDFHMLIAQASQNPYFADSYERLLDEGRRILHLHYTKHQDAKNPYPLSPEHYDMIEAIREQDEETADKLAHQHTRLFHQRIMDFFKVNYVEEV